MRQENKPENNKKDGKVKLILPSKENIILGVLIVAVLILVILYIVDKIQIAELKRKIAANTEAGISQEYKDKLTAEITKEINEGEQKYIVLNDDLSKTNMSDKLKEIKKIGDLEIKDMQIITADNVTTVKASVTNNGSVTDGNFMVDLDFKNDNGRSILKIKAYINKVEPGKTVLLTTTTTTDFANAYDYTITKEK